MALARQWCAPLLALLLLAAPLAAQGTGSVTGRVTDAATQQPITGAAVSVGGRGSTTGADGRFTVSGVAAGAHTVRVSRVGYAESTQPVSVAAGQTATVNVQMSQQVVQLEELVAVGYGTQRREAVTGSVAAVSAREANVGQITAPTEMIQGRIAGVQVMQNDGAPGGGVRVRIRGGTSISASNEPLYVIDGVPINNAATEPTSLGQNNSLPRNPLNLINPNDVESITVLKDASATAIYGSRGANGVILIQTKRGREGRSELTYEGYVASSTPYRHLDVLNGDEYRSFVQGEVAAGRLAATRLQGLGQFNTNWENEVLRNAMTQNHNLSFSGGGANTQFRGSLSYMNQEGIVLSSGLERLSGRINANQQALNNRLRLGLNLNASQVKNDYVPYENTGGFTGTIFTNMMIMNPTNPVRVTDPSTGQQVFYEIAPGAPSIRNPVAIAEQIDDDGVTRRVLGNVSADYDLFRGLTAQFNVGTDRSDGVRSAYYPKISPLGAGTNGDAIIGSVANVTNTFQSYLTYRTSARAQDFDLLGGYEFNQYSTVGSTVQSQGFITDAFGYYNLGAGAIQQPSSSSRTDSRLVSFFGRANWSLLRRYYLTGVLRYDGSSRFGEGNKWGVFPAVSAAWRVSDEGFMQGSFISELRLKAGYGIQGSQEISPYSSLITLTPGARASFGETTIIGVSPNRNPNPDLKWEQTAQWNVGLEYGFWDNLLSGSVDFYNKDTKDLLLTVPVPQPAVVADRLENIGRVRNRGVEFTLDARALQTDRLDLTLGLVGSVDRNEVVSLGKSQFIATGGVSGQGQSNQNSQRIMPGYAIGTFFGPEYAGVDAQGRQLFNKYDVTRDEKGNIVSRTLVGQTLTPTGNDFVVLGNALPDYSLGMRGQATWGNLDLNFLVRGVFGNDVLNNTALVYSTKGNALQDKNFLKSALTDPIAITQPAIFSSRWIEDGSFVRLQNVTLGWTIPQTRLLPQARNTRVYVSGDNLLLLTDYTGYDPEVQTESGLASLGIDYLKYPNPRTLTFGVRVGF